MVGQLSSEETENLLRRHSVGRIGCYANDRPYVVPINFAYDGTAVYAASGPGRKIDAMRAHPRVSFEIDEIDGAGIWRSVIADGIYEELTCECARSDAMRRLGQSGVGATPCGLEVSGNIVVFRIHLLEKTGRFGRGS
jgi:nitroimidazol reductase NimA-like FMN-containing flavoprotein (pyridoxamine 5'-phosphate oxidase superfamily)